MRNLGDAASVAWQRGNISLAITPQDGAAGWTFGLADLADISPISFEVPFGGGLAKPSLYNATISTSVGWWLQNRQRLGRANAALTMNVGSSSFQIHVGRVRGIDLDPLDLNKVNVQVVDRLLDQDPLVPVEAIIDSWSTPHLEDLQSGYPLYYGQALRPAYMVAVTCDLSVLLGPRNVQSADHTGFPYWIAGAPGIQPLQNDPNAFICVATWAQQSGSTNVMSNTGLILQAFLPAKTRLAGLTGNALRESNLGDFSFSDASSNTQVSTYGAGIFVMGIAAEISETFVSNQQLRQRANLNLSPGFGLQILDVISYAGVLTVGSIAASNPRLDLYFAQAPAAGKSAVVSDKIFIISSTGLLVNCFAGTFPIGTFILKAGSVFGFEDVPTLSPGGTNFQMTFTCSLSFGLALDGQQFKRYSVFTPQVNSADIAISTNPWAIIDDVTSHYTLSPYRQDQSSAVQVAIQSYQFNTLFHERQNLSKILDDFGTTCGVLIWQGDSGMLNYRAYAESASATIDRTIASGNYYKAHLISNPIGTTTFDTQGFSKFQVDYAYDYQLGKYINTVVADRNSNALCGSAFAAGVQKTKAVQTKNIMAAAVASLYIGQLVRKYGQAQDFIELDLDHTHLGLEVADVLQVQHPALPGGADVFQVTQLKLDLMAGTVHVLAGRLLSAAGG